MAELIDTGDVFDYFEELCTKNKLILHTPNAPRFARDAEEVAQLSAHLMNTNSPFVVMDEVSNRLIDRRSNNRLSRKLVRFFVLQNVPGMNDFAARQEVYEKTELIVRQFVRKWYKDMYAFEAPMKWLQPETVAWASVWYPVYENAFGTEVSFELFVEFEAEIVYDADEWLP